MKASDLEQGDELTNNYDLITVGEIRKDLENLEQPLYVFMSTETGVNAYTEEEVNEWIDDYDQV